MSPDLRLPLGNIRRIRPILQPMLVKRVDVALHVNQARIDFQFFERKFHLVFQLLLL